MILALIFDLDQSVAGQWRNQPAEAHVVILYLFVVDRRPGGAQAGTRRLRMDPDDVLLAAHWSHVSCVVVRLSQGESAVKLVVLVD